MNMEQRPNGARGDGDGMLSPKCPPHVTNKKKRVRNQRFVGAGLLFFGSAALLLCLLLLILPLFSVQSVEVVGNSLYSEAEILKAAGVRTGGETLAIDANQIASRLLDNAPYVQSCKISVLPFSVKIEIEEKENVMYTEYEEEFITMEYREKDHSFRVLEVLESAPDDFRYVLLPQISSAKAGGRVTFTRENLDLSYVAEVLDSLNHYGIYSSVTSLDLSSTSNLSYEVNNRCTVKLGKLSGIDSKIADAIDLLNLHPDAVEVDVRNSDAPTVR